MLWAPCLKEKHIILSGTGPKTEVQCSAEKNVIMDLQANFPYSKIESLKNKYRL